MGKTYRMFCNAEGKSTWEEIDWPAYGDWAKGLDVTKIRFASRAPGELQEWHPAPQRQFIFILGIMTCWHRSAREIAHASSCKEFQALRLCQQCSPQTQRDFSLADYSCKVCNSTCPTSNANIRMLPKLEKRIRYNAEPIGGR